LRAGIKGWPQELAPTALPSSIAPAILSGTREVINKPLVEISEAEKAL